MVISSRSEVNKIKIDKIKLNEIGSTEIEEVTKVQAPTNESS